MSEDITIPFKEWTAYVSNDETVTFWPNTESKCITVTFDQWETITETVSTFKE